MAKIEKIENVMADDKISKVVMSINNGEEVVEGEVYLAFVDINTDKRYMVYTTEQAKGENDRIPFTLSTLVLEENGYVLEETSKEDHQNIELPILNIIGLNSDKKPEQVLKMINEKFPGVAMLSLQALKINVDNMTISETKPPKKANMPIAIANVIKKFYLYQLNKELDKIYNATEMSPENKNQSVEKLDEIESKLDSVKETYEQNIEKKGGSTPKIEKSLDQIEIAKKDIEAAKNRIQNLPDEYVEEEMIEPEELQVEEGEFQETEQLSDSISVEEAVDNNGEVVDETDTNFRQVEQSLQEDTNPLAQDTIQNEINNLIGESVEEFATNFETLVNKLSDGITGIYQKYLIEKETMIQLLQDQLKKQEEMNRQEKSEMLTQITTLGKKANEVNQQAVHSKEIVEELKQQLTISQQNEQQLKKDNEELREEITSQKQQLDQQNALMDSLREESRNRDEQQQAEISRLQSENKSLKIYEEGYNKIAGMFAGKGMPTPTIDPEQQLIDEAVEHAMSQQPTK